MKQIRSRLTYANVMASLAVFLVLGGGAAFAALGKNTVGTKQLKKNAVTTAKIKNETVTSGKIKNGAVVNGKLGSGAVSTDKIADSAVTTVKIANDAVTGDKVNESTLGEVPTAGFAKVAGSAQNVYTALIGSSGTVIRSVPSGVTAFKLGTGIYEVDFHRPIATCTWFVAPSGDDFIPQLGEASAVPRAGNENALFVDRANSAGSLTDGDFYAQLYC